MPDILIQGGRVIDPASGRDEVADVAIADGTIAAIAPAGGGKPGGPRAGGGKPGGPRGARAAEVIDAAGLLVCPGLIDPHVHCREPGREGEETIATAAAAAVAGGFTTIVAMPNTDPPQDDETAIQYVLQRAAQANRARVLPAGCITKGRAGEELAEMALMQEAGAVAFTDDGEGVASTAVMHRALQYAGMIGAPLLQHCQDPALFGGAMHSGATAVRLGLRGIPASGEEIMLRRDLELLRRTRGRYHMLHVSSAGSVELLRRAKADGLAVTAEATPHHLLLTDAACMGFDSNYKMNPPLRSADDVEALRAGVADGTIDCLASDHAPHAAEQKELEFALAPFGIISLDCALGLYAQALLRTGTLDWPSLIERMTVGPARVLGRAIGRLEVGGPADVTVIDPKKRWTVRTDRFASKSRNCPYDGWKLRGRAVMTIVGGDVKYRL